MNKVELVECPRDAMQGIADYIPPDIKAAYLNSLLQVGFDVLDFGSFVSPKAIPQLRDTAEVLEQLDLSRTHTRLLAIVANARGGEEALIHEEIDCLGYPFSISETFQQRNTQTSIDDSFRLVENLQNRCIASGRELVVYLSMAFGNPYGDPWSPELALHWSERLASAGVKTLAISDTVGLATASDVDQVFSALIPALPSVKIGAHLHCRPDNWRAKLEAAWNAGCRRFDSALRGFGGCPMAEDELVGNLATENLLSFLRSKNAGLSLNASAFEEAMNKSEQIFFPPLQHQSPAGV